MNPRTIRRAWPTILAIAVCLVAGLALGAPAAAQASAEPTAAAAAGPSACICRCSIQDGYDWEWGYYEPDENGSCDLNCENCCVHEGQLGDLEMCKKVPRPIQTSAQAEGTAARVEEFLRWLATAPDEE